MAYKYVSEFTFVTRESVRYDVKDSKGRFIGHNIYLYLYDVNQDKANINATEGRMCYCINGEQRNHRFDENVKFVYTCQITRNGHDYGATQDKKPLKARNVDEALEEIKKIALKKEKDAMKKYNKGAA